MNLSFESLAPTLMIVFRYAMSGFGVWLVNKGFSESDASTLVEQAAFFASGGVIAALPALYAILKRPSAKAMATAKAVDQQVPKGEDVVIKTPTGEPDIVVPATKGAQ